MWLLLFSSPAVSCDPNRNNTGSAAVILPLISNSTVIPFFPPTVLLFLRQGSLIPDRRRQCLFQPCRHPYNFYNKTAFALFFVLSAKYRHHRQSDLAKRLFKGIGDNSIAALLLLFLTSAVNSKLFPIRNDRDLLGHGFHPPCQALFF